MYNDDNTNPYSTNFSLYGEPYNPDRNDSMQDKAQETVTVEIDEPRSRKKGFTFRKALLGVGCALVLGAVAGAACYGVAYAGFTLFPIKQEIVQINMADSTNNQSNLIPNIKQNQELNVNVNATVMDVSELVKAVIPSVVEITGTYTYTAGSFFWGQGQTQTATISGSGIIIEKTDAELLIVTNYHVIESVDEGTMKVKLYDGSIVSANVKGTDSAHDLAVIALQLSAVPSDAVYTIATLGDSTEVEVGDAAIAIGNSMGSGISVTTGIVSALGRTVVVENVTYENLIQTDAAINSGNSGGALFNAKGEVIGINSVKMNNSSDNNVEGMGYAISISNVQDIINDLSQEVTKIRLSDEERGYLGLSGITITADISQTYGYPEGILIRTIAEGSAADKAGLVKRDVLATFDGRQLNSYDELYQMMFYYPAGAVVEVTYYHVNAKGEYELMTTSVTLSSYQEISSSN